MKKMPALFLLLVFSCSTRYGDNTDFQFVPADNETIAYIGRFDFSDSKNPEFMYSGCAIRTVFEGTSIAMVLKDDSRRNFFNVILDDSLFVLKTNRRNNEYLLGSGLKEGRHTLEIVRRTEWHGGNTTFSGFYINKNGTTEKPEIKERQIEFIGDSYTCGYGNEGQSAEEHFKYETENNYLAFGALTARALDAEYIAVCRSGIGMYQGYGAEEGFAMPAYYDTIVSGGETVGDYGLYQPQVVVITLGANDMSLDFDPARFKGAYAKFLTRIRKNYPETTIICVAGPSSGDEKWSLYQSAVQSVVTEFGRNDNQTFYFAFTPFEMNGSGWHPNVAEHRKMSSELVPVIRELTGW